MGKELRKGLVKVKTEEKEAKTTAHTYHKICKCGEYFITFKIDGEFSNKCRNCIKNKQ